MIKLKRYILIFMLALTSITFATSANAETAQIEFKVVNMRGLTDQYKVRKILSSLEGIRKVVLTDDLDVVLLVFDDELSSLFDIKTALAAQGYPATGIRLL